MQTNILVGDMVKADGSAVYEGTESADGITFTSVNTNWGGGMAFYLNKDKSVVDLKDYSKVRVTLSSTDASTPVCFAFFTGATPDNYLYSAQLKNGSNSWTKYGNTDATANKDTTIEWDLSENSADSLEAYAIMVKHNGYPNGLDSMSDDEKAEAKKITKTITIKSIELVK